VANLSTTIAQSYTHFRIHIVHLAFDPAANAVEDAKRPIRLGHPDPVGAVAFVERTTETMPNAACLVGRCRIACFPWS
jgi:hypothetical protein